jgi:hypothetical protein
MADAVIDRLNRFATLTITVGGLIVALVGAWFTSQSTLSDIGRQQDKIAVQVDQFAQAVTKLDGAVTWLRSDLTKLETRLDRIEQHR